MTNIKLSEADEAWLDSHCWSHNGERFYTEGNVRTCLASRPSAPVAQALPWGDFLRCVTLACNGAIASDDLDECIKALRYIRGCVGEYLKGNPSGSVPAPQPEAGMGVDVDLVTAARNALHYMRLHKYADQAWADDLERALARQLSAAQVPGVDVEAPRISVVEALAELADLVDAHREGEYKIDSFTTQPARIALAQEQSAPAAGESGKPSWDDAPEWAQWLAQDEDGEWFWYEDKPFRDVSFWNATFPAKVQTAYECEIENPNWRNTLQPRPAGADGGAV